jgi:hypothetical protein
MSSRRLLTIVCLSGLVFFGLRSPALAAPIVISQVYGGGGNTGAPFTHDFIELFNASSDPLSLAGWSLQYASATGTGAFGANAAQLTELPSVTLMPGQYFLVQQGAGAGAGVALPLPDLIDATPIAMSATAGKVALVNSVVSLGCNGGSTPCGPAELAMIIDLVGYGNANFFEGAGAAPTLSNTTAAIRGLGGCTDSGNNSADFVAGAPTPRNMGSALSPCETTVPEPGALLLMASGLAALVTSRASISRRMRR